MRRQLSLLQLRYGLGALLLSPLLPLMYLQGRQILKYFKQNPVVPPGGNTEGIIQGGPDELQLLVLGESTVAGIGALTFENSLSVKLAETLSNEAAISVSWKAVGKSGATAELAYKELLPTVDKLEKYNIVVLVLGANDSFALCSPSKWIKDIEKLMNQIRQKRPNALIYLASLPPVGDFPTLPQPTRWVLGQFNRLLSKASKLYADQNQRIIYSQAQFENRKHMLCSDGIHPSEEGYALWAKAIAKELLPHMEIPNRQSKVA